MRRDATHRSVKLVASYSALRITPGELDVRGLGLEIERATRLG